MSDDKPDDFTAKTAIDPRYAGTGARRALRAAIAPDDVRSHRAVIVSGAMLRELWVDAFVAGFACSGRGFNGETRAVSAPAAMRLVRTEAERAWHARNKG